MPVIEALRKIYATSAASISFTPRSGTAAMINAIGVKTSIPGFIKISSGNTTVGFYEVGPDVRSHLQYAPSNSNKNNMMLFLAGLAIATSIPVAQGDVFLVELLTGTADFVVSYSEVAPGDIKPDDWNGTSGKKATLLIYGTNSAALTAAGYSRLDKCLNPTEMHSWPFEEIQCPFEKITVHGIGGLLVQENTYTSSVNGYASTSKLQLWKGRELLFHTSEAGFLLEGSGAVAGSANKVYGSGVSELPYNSLPGYLSPMFFPTPLEFVRGDELNIKEYVDVDATAQIDAEDLRVVLIATTGGK